MTIVTVTLTTILLQPKLSAALTATLTAIIHITTQPSVI